MNTFIEERLMGKLAAIPVDLFISSFADTAIQILNIYPQFSRDI